MDGLGIVCYHKRKEVIALRDIPVFTTQYGVASLTLNQIPYRKEAYIRIQAVLDAQQLIDECVGFCKMAGAERIFATGHDALTKYNLHCRVLTMTADYDQSQTTQTVLKEVNEDTIENWREIYNEKMQYVANASYLTAAEAQRLLEYSYFAYRHDTLIGICAGRKGRIDVIAGVVKGAGRDIVIALCEKMQANKVTCEVASTNTAAMKLYERLGFAANDDGVAWYRVRY